MHGNPLLFGDGIVVCSSIQKQSSGLCVQLLQQLPCGRILRHQRHKLFRIPTCSFDAPLVAVHGDQSKERLSIMGWRL